MSNFDIVTCPRCSALYEQVEPGCCAACGWAPGAQVSTPPPLDIGPPPEMTKEQILDGCIEKWGADAQINQAVEELAELIVALNHERRRRHGATEKCEEEIADVSLMLDQLKRIFSSDRIREHESKKLKRLEYRLKANLEVIG